MEKQTSPQQGSHKDPANMFDPKAASPFLFSGGHPGWLGPVRPTPGYEGRAI